MQNTSDAIPENELKELIETKNVAALRDRASALISTGNLKGAAPYFKALADIDPSDLMSRYNYVQTSITHDAIGYTAARNELLKILSDYPQLLTQNSDFSNMVMRSAVHTLIWTNQMEQAAEIGEKLVALTNLAADFDLLKDIYPALDELKKELWARKESARLDPTQYATPENLAKIKQYEDFFAEEDKKKKISVRRYPTIEKLQGDLGKLIKEETIWSDIEQYKPNRGEEPCIAVWGGCWHRDFGHGLEDLGIRHHYLPIADDVNTCSGNLQFAEWLHESQTHPAKEALEKSVRESAEALKQKLSESNIIILSYTKGFELRDNANDQNILGELSIFTMKAMTQKFNFGLSPIERNVRSIVRTIDLLRQISPNCTIVLQISPTPIFGTPGHESPISNDFLSKAMLRVSINEVITNWNIDKLVYWPTIEIFRWIASHQTDYFGGDDGSAWHVSLGRTKQMVKTLVGALTNHPLSSNEHA